MITSPLGPTNSRASTCRRAPPSATSDFDGRGCSDDSSLFFMVQKVQRLDLFGQQNTVNLGNIPTSAGSCQDSNPVIVPIHTLNLDIFQLCKSCFRLHVSGCRLYTFVMATLGAQSKPARPSRSASQQPEHFMLLEVIPCRATKARSSRRFHFGLCKIPKSGAISAAAPLLRR
jgi:hypothetical protein